MSLRWFLSSKVRHATQMWKHVRKILSAQRDLLAPEAIQAVSKAIEDLRQTARTRSDKVALEAQMTNLEKVANKWLKPYPSAALRENVEVLLVAIAVAMGIRTFLLQPFKIPTGSMQPTLFGITEENLLDRPDYTVPNPLVRFLDYWYRGISFKHETALADGPIEKAEPKPQKFLLFNLKQNFYIAGVKHTVWFPPDDLWRRAGLLDTARMGQVYRRGEDVIKLRVISGDHLFVNRVSYNFRRPKRGEIIVFETRGIAGIQQQDQFYIKRLVALGGETVRILDDRHLEIDGRRLDASTPRFENVYSFDPNEPPENSKYSGHLNATILNKHSPRGFETSMLFTNDIVRLFVEPRHYLVMGDNSMNSSDSRYWGDFPQGNVIGKASFVYWPIGSQDSRRSRFGWGLR
jgi:signal peptidase I